MIIGLDVLRLAGSPLPLGIIIIIPGKLSGVVRMFVGRLLSNLVSTISERRSLDAPNPLACVRGEICAADRDLKSTLHEGRKCHTPSGRVAPISPSLRVRAEDVGPES